MRAHANAHYIEDRVHGSDRAYAYNRTVEHCNCVNEPYFSFTAESLDQSINRGNEPRA